MHILGEIQSKHVKANPKVNKEYERRSSNSVSVSTPAEKQDLCLTISLLNVRSLRKHSKDIKFHSELFESDVLAFTETQLLPDVSGIEIAENLKPFKIYRQDHETDKYSSMAICVKNTLEVRENSNSECHIYAEMNYIWHHLLTHAL